MFFFSATRTAFLVASFHKDNKLPDGSIMTRTVAEQSLIDEVYSNHFQVRTNRDQKSFDQVKQQNLTNSENLHESGQIKPISTTYEDWCGVIRDHHGPFWPPGVGPFYPAPQHIYPELPNTSRGSVSSKTRENKNSLLAISKQAARFRSHRRTQDQEPTMNAAWGQSRVVFDSECSPRWTAAMLEAIAASSQLITSNINPGWIPPTLAFESRFESGNLREARRIGPFEYELTLRPDQYTKRHVQWFYFALCNASPGYVYRFVITNFTKRTSLYSKGWY
ncbi:Cytosolic carboxypeptidase 3 [Fasciolopsis buskii]|uniref:Cytosolic carboxypeptidase 3 n=1 Tax=Fasciolopsis buskii TaxID=27845 RepID=A0A8E0VJZ5_9TREM|nr:Cytosolic carboxypeptidase 3 [Fasciolopsis buski]